MAMSDEARRLSKRQICEVFDVPPWLVSPTEPWERWWWYRSWPRRKIRLLVNGWKRRRTP